MISCVICIMAFNLRKLLVHLRKTDDFEWHWNIAMFTNMWKIHRYLVHFALTLHFGTGVNVTLLNLDKAKQKICMFAFTRQSLLNSSDPNLFFRENLQKIKEDLSKKFNSCLDTVASCIFLLFASSVPFNVIEMIYLLS